MQRKPHPTDAAPPPAPPLAPPPAPPPRVDFVVAGAQKSGTRALHSFLSRHPQIGLGTRQEVHFFDRTPPAADLGAERAAYHAHFTEEALAKVTGDVTPIYIYLRDIPARMRRYNPDLKVIVMLRDPVARAYSQWNMQHARGEDRLGFLATVLMEPLRWLRHGQHKVHSHVARGFYDRQIGRLLAAFPPEQCLILRNEDLAERHDETLRRIYRFLAVQEVVPPPPARVHARDYRPIPPLAAWLLRRVYARDLRRLERRLGWDLSAWRRGPEKGRQPAGPSG